MRRINLFFVGLLFLLPPMANAAEIKLLTSIKPLQLIGAALVEGVEQVQVDVLLPVGASAHHYALRPIDISRIQSADLFYWIGKDMEIFLVKVLQNRAKQTVAFTEEPNLYLRHFNAESEAHDEHDYEHQAGGIDLHLWLSPANARVIAQKMAADLSLLDPANKTKYQENLKVFEKALTVLDNDIKQRLANSKLKPFFVLHETYDYFEEAYGIKHAGVFSVNSSVQPGIKQVAEIREQIKKTGESCIFYEPPMPPKLASTLINGLPIKLIMLDAMGDNAPVTAKGYLNLLNTLVEEVLNCQ